MGDIVKFTESTVGELDRNLKDVRIPRANLGPCPVCGHDIVENRKGTRAGRATTRGAAS